MKVDIIKNGAAGLINHSLFKGTENVELSNENAEILIKAGIAVKAGAPVPDEIHTAESEESKGVLTEAKLKKAVAKKK